MRKSQSQFNLVCTFINMWKPGAIFTTRQYIDAVGHKENLTGWKRYSNNKHYMCHQYKGYLRKAGFIKNISRGYWQVEKNIPSWFTLGHLHHLLGYNYRGAKYMGRTRDALRNLLNASKVPVITRKVDNISAGKNPSNVTTGSSRESFKNTAKKILNNSTYGNKKENHPLVKTATIQKIDHKESDFFKEPSISTGDQRIDIMVNIGVLESAKAVLSQFTSNSAFERARVYNVMAQVDHISKEQQEKLNPIS